MPYLLPLLLPAPLAQLPPASFSSYAMGQYFVFLAQAARDRDTACTIDVRGDLELGERPQVLRAHAEEHERCHPGDATRHHLQYGRWRWWWFPRAGVPKMTVQEAMRPDHPELCKRFPPTESAR
eukprot:scaffold137695_cov27-Tisochrysis_lutea.AAC.1